VSLKRRSPADGTGRASSDDVPARARNRITLSNPDAESKSEQRRRKAEAAKQRVWAYRELARKIRADKTLRYGWRLILLAALDYAPECSAAYETLGRDVAVSGRTARRWFEKINGRFCRIEKRKGRTDLITFPLLDFLSTTPDNMVSAPNPDEVVHNPGQFEHQPRTESHRTPDNMVSDERENERRNSAASPLPRNGEASAAREKDGIREKEFPEMPHQDDDRPDPAARAAMSEKFEALSNQLKASAASDRERESELKRLRRELDMTRRQVPIAKDFQAAALAAQAAVAALIETPAGDDELRAQRWEELQGCAQRLTTARDAAVAVGLDCPDLPEVRGPLH
jgi:hypothetical protein